MKKLLLLITGLLLLFSLEGQILRYSNYTTPVPPEEVPDFYDEFDTVYAAFATKPHADTAALMEAMVYSLDTLDFEGGASVWDRMDLLYIAAVHDSTDALINWISPGTFNADNYSSTAFAKWEGFTGDGVADYISTNWNPYSNGSNYTQNSASIGIYLRKDIQETTPKVWGARDVGTNRMYLFPRNSTDYADAALNSTAVTHGSSTNSSGLWIVTRRADNEIEVYRNGGSIDAESDASTAVPNRELYILANGGVGEYSVHQFSVFFAMNAISDAEAIAINTIIETFMDGLGKGVQ